MRRRLTGIEELHGKQPLADTLFNAGATPWDLPRIYIQPVLPGQTTFLPTRQHNGQVSKLKHTELAKAAQLGTTVGTPRRRSLTDFDCITSTLSDIAQDKMERKQVREMEQKGVLKLAKKEYQKVIAYEANRYSGFRRRSFAVSFLEQDAQRKQKIQIRKAQNIVKLWEEINKRIARHGDIKRAFDTFDKDNSGALSNKEFKVFMQKLIKMKISSEDFKLVFGFLDSDGTGTIDYGEFEDFLRGGHRQQIWGSINTMCVGVGGISNAFSWLDADGTGDLDCSEFRDGLEQNVGLRITHSDYTSIFSLMDINDSGVIEYHEFEQFMLSHKFEAATWLTKNAFRCDGMPEDVLSSAERAVNPLMLWERLTARVPEMGDITDALHEIDTDRKGYVDFFKFHMFVHNVAKMELDFPSTQVLFDFISVKKKTIGISQFVDFVRSGHRLEICKFIFKMCLSRGSVKIVWQFICGDISDDVDVSFEDFRQGLQRACRKTITKSDIRHLFQNYSKLESGVIGLTAFESFLLTHTIILNEHFVPTLSLSTENDISILTMCKKLIAFSLRAADIKSMFHKYDSAGIGALTRLDFHLFAQDVSECKINSRHTRLVCELLDTDSNFMVKYKDFDAFIHNRNTEQLWHSLITNRRASVPLLADFPKSLGSMIDAPTETEAPPTPQLIVKAPWMQDAPVPSQLSANNEPETADEAQHITIPTRPTSSRSRQQHRCFQQRLSLVEDHIHIQQDELDALPSQLSSVQSSRTEPSSEPEGDWDDILLIEPKFNTYKRASRRIRPEISKRMYPRPKGSTSLNKDQQGVVNERIQKWLSKQQKIKQVTEQPVQKPEHGVRNPVPAWNNNFQASLTEENAVDFGPQATKKKQLISCIRKSLDHEQKSARWRNHVKVRKQVKTKRAQKVKKRAAEQRQEHEVKLNAAQLQEQKCRAKLLKQLCRPDLI